MTVHLIAARETVQAIRESQARSSTPDSLSEDLARALYYLDFETLKKLPESQSNFEIIELWARLAADTAASIHQRTKGDSG